MQFRSILMAAGIALTAATLPTAVLGHSKVVNSTPAQGANVSSPKTITLNFSEALLPPTAAASVVMTAMPGVKNHGEMVIRNFTTEWSNGNRTMTLKLRKPLGAGSYAVRWQEAGADGHRMKGTVSFTVR